ncbi:hypothetical protein RFI_25825 [Reticulomyxa filosa]|uniref:F-actin-capping protein subunit alpha n=1 Tax=Reticulomyxa filosa TaxID=46433 RepID=X6MD02_RETFI|nr:hypothetical protein RFI_25825 [Reticulomyxa filosa]|eukprot:ETO11551.1 hypothetical protein RFI_25825 [Reticulomyxa filosa]
MAEEYTPDQQKKIAKHFVLVAPHGEVHDLTKELQTKLKNLKNNKFVLLTDLRAVVKGGLLDDKWLHAAMTEYNKRHFEIAESDKTKVICCPQGEVEANKYLNPEKKVICTVDPVTQVFFLFGIRADVILSGEFLEFREKAHSKLKEYLNGFYEDGTTNPASMSRGQGTVYVSPDGQLAVVISFKNLNVSNYWTGGWQSEWTVKLGKKGPTKLEGRIRLKVHYYEDGNVQLNSTFNETGEVEVSVEFFFLKHFVSLSASPFFLGATKKFKKNVFEIIRENDPSSTATALINTIRTLENDFQLRLEKFYVQMHDSTFKNMRRYDNFKKI